MKKWAEKKKQKKILNKILFKLLWRWELILIEVKAKQYMFILLSKTF